MATCPDCGEIVMEGDPYCSNCGATFRWIDDDDDSDSYAGRSYSPPPLSPEELLASTARSYNDYINRAREATEKAEIIRLYGYAIDEGNRYWDYAKRNGLKGGAIPDRNHLLPYQDVERCSRFHYNLLGKGGFFSNSQTQREGFEDILERSGNSDRISTNKSKRRDELRVQSEAAARRRESLSVRDDRETYFKSLDKANDAVVHDDPKKAIKNYRKAVESHKSYFSRDYEKYDGVELKTMPKPPERLTDEARYYLLELYKITHPLLTSSKKRQEINSEVAGLLADLHKDDLERADGEVQEIVRQRKLKRQNQKERAEEVIVDGIVEVRKLIGRIRK